MRHRVAGKHLGRTPSHRRALRRNMAMSLLQHGAIRTTETKAKELRRFVEKIITIAKKGTLHARRRVIAELQDRDIYDAEGKPLDQTVVQKLFDEIAPAFADRPGGYTRLIRLPDRRIGDAGKQVLIQLVMESAPAGEATLQGESRRQRRAAKRIAAAGDIDVQEAQAAPAAEAEETAESADEGADDQDQTEDAQQDAPPEAEASESEEEPGGEEKPDVAE